MQPITGGVASSEAAVVHRVFEWYLAGTGIPTIVHRLTEEGTAGPRGVMRKAGAR